MQLRLRLTLILRLIYQMKPLAAETVLCTLHVFQHPCRCAARPPSNLPITNFLNSIEICRWQVILRVWPMVRNLFGISQVTNKFIVGRSLDNISKFFRYLDIAQFRDQQRGICIFSQAIRSLGGPMVIHSAASTNGPGFNSPVARAYLIFNYRASTLADNQCWLCAVRLQQTVIV